MGGDHRAPQFRVSWRGFLRRLKCYCGGAHVPALTEVRTHQGQLTKGQSVPCAPAAKSAVHVQTIKGRETQNWVSCGKMEMMRKPLPPRLRYQEWIADVERALARGTAPGLARVLSLLSSNCTAEAFYAAVTETHPEIAATYLRTIRRPIDLGRIMRRAVAGAYNSVNGMARCRRNVRRMLFNAEAFNSEDPLICSLAGHLRAYFDDLWLTMYTPDPGCDDQATTSITGRTSPAAASDGAANKSRRLRGNLLKGAGLPEADLRSCIDIVDEMVDIYRCTMPHDYFSCVYREQQQQRSECGTCGETLISDSLEQTRSWLLAAADAARAESSCSMKRHLRAGKMQSMQGRLGSTEVQQGGGASVVDSSGTTAAGKEGGSGENTDGSAAAAEATLASRVPESPSLFEIACLEVSVNASRKVQSEEEADSIPADLIPGLPVVASDIDLDAFQSRMNDNFAIMENFQFPASSSPSPTSAGHAYMANFWIAQQLKKEGVLPSSLLSSGAWRLALRAMQDCFSLRLEELAVALRERITRGSNQSSVWASPLGVFWATPLNAKHSRPWPALLLAGEGIAKMSSEIGTQNLRRIPDGIKQQLKRQRKPTREQLALVEFLGTHEFAWVRSSSLVLFRGNSTCNSSPSSKKGAVPMTAYSFKDSGAVLSTKRGRPRRPNGGGSSRQGKPNRKFQEALHEAACFLEGGFGLLRRGNLSDIPLPLKTPDWFLVGKRAARHAAKTLKGVTKRRAGASIAGSCMVGGAMGMVSGHVPEDGSEEEEDEDYMEADYGTASSSSDEEGVVSVFNIGGILLDPSSGCPWRGNGRRSSRRKSAHVHQRALTFPDELAKILSESRHHSEIIAWSADNGSKVVVKDQRRLETSVLSKYCASLRKMASFQFQLGAFGFVPVDNDEADEAEGRDMPVRSFAHAEFKRDNDAVVNAEILKSRAADNAALTSRHRSGTGDDFKSPEFDPAQSDTMSGRTAHPGESCGVGRNSARTAVFGPGSLERRWRALLRVDKYLGKLRKGEGLPPLMDSCTSIFRSAPFRAPSPDFGGRVKGGVWGCHQGHQPVTSKKRPAQRGRSSASCSKSRHAKAPYIFGEHYLTGSESSGDEGACVEGRLYGRIELWATPIAMPLIESAQNWKSLHGTLCGMNGQVSKHKLAREWRQGEPTDFHRIPMALSSPIIPAFPLLIAHSSEGQKR